MRSPARRVRRLRRSLQQRLVGPQGLVDREELRQWVRTQLIEVSRSDNPAVRRGYLISRNTARRLIRRLTGRQLGWVAMLRSARWTGPTTFAFTGWAYERGFGYRHAAPRTRLWLQSGASRIEITTEMVVEPEVNASAVNATYDYANTAFRAELDLAVLHAHLPAAVGASRTWTVQIEVLGPDGIHRRGSFVQRERIGSPRHLSTRTLDDGTQLVPAFTGADGLTFSCVRPVVHARDVTVSGRVLTATLVSGVELSEVAVATDDVSSERLRLTPSPALVGAMPGPDPGLRTYEVSGAIPTVLPRVAEEVPLSITRVLVATTTTGARHVVATGLDDTAPEVSDDSTVLVASGPGGVLAVLDAPGRVLVDAWELERHAGPDGVPILRLRGRYVVAPEADPGHDVVPTLAFVGSRQVLAVTTDVAPGSGGRGEWSGSVPLSLSEWGRPSLPPRQGIYVLRGLLPNGDVVAVSGVPELSAGTVAVHALDGFRLILQSGGGRSVRFKVSPPRRPEELGSFQQRRLERTYLGKPHAPEDAVYFESFYGRAATCNPRAIDAEIARSRPELTRYWGVVDASVPVPEGAVPVVRGTREWWEARAGARWVVANDWVRRQLEPQPFQVVLQTWHGSMLKRIGLDRPKVPADKRKIIEVEQAKWDLLLSQNRHSSDILRSAYAWDGPILEEGYPRNDPLTPGSVQAGDGAAIRAALGIAPHQTAVLYAPTWRENMTEMVTFLDLERLAGKLGDDHVILLRGHSRTVAFGESVSMRGVIDVTTHPEVTDLFLAADALITDYSSVMFDYSVTGRPMIFYVPDMEAYRDSLRGVYFDLSEVAPGPVLSEQDDVADAIGDLASAGDRYADAYGTWVERFNAYDDGDSARRVTEQLLTFEK